MKKIALIVALICITGARPSDDSMSTGSNDTAMTDIGYLSADGVCDVCRHYEQRHDEEAGAMMIKHAESDLCAEAKLRRAAALWQMSEEEEGVPTKAFALVDHACRLTSLDGTPDPSGAAHVMKAAMLHSCGASDKALEAAVTAEERHHALGIYYQVLIALDGWLANTVDSYDFRAAQLRLDHALKLAKGNDEVEEIETLSKALRSAAIELHGDRNYTTVRDCPICRTVIKSESYQTVTFFQSKMWLDHQAHVQRCHHASAIILRIEQIFDQYAVVNWLASSMPTGADFPASAFEKVVQLSGELIKVGRPEGYLYCGQLEYWQLRRKISLDDNYAVYDPKMLRVIYSWLVSAAQAGIEDALFWLQKVAYEYDRGMFDLAAMQDIAVRGDQRAARFLKIHGYKISPPYDDDGDSTAYEGEEEETVAPPRPKWWHKVFVWCR